MHTHTTAIITAINSCTPHYTLKYNKAKVFLSKPKASKRSPCVRNYFKINYKRIQPPQTILTLSCPIVILRTLYNHILYSKSCYPQIMESHLTSSPNSTPISSATRLATDMAATRRGCVHPTLPNLHCPS